MPSSRVIPAARSPSTRIPATSQSVKYSTPSLRPAETSASLIAWLPPTAIAAGSNDSTSGRLCTKPWSPGASSGKQPVDVVAARMNSVRSSSLSKKSYASCRTLMNWCTGSMTLSGTLEQLLERVGLAPRRRRAEAVRAERGLPVLLELVEQAQVRVRVAARELADLLVRAVDALLRALGPCPSP